MFGRKDSNSGMNLREIPRYVVFISLAASLWLVGCGKQHREKGPNVILISMDTTRRDHCSVYGYKRDTTPNLQAFGNEGVIFDQAYAPSSTTGPSHATMFTSLHPITHQVLKNGLKLSAKHTTIAEILKDQGYETAAILGSFVLDAKFGYGKGFTFYDDNFELNECKLQLKFWEGFRVDGAFDRRANHTTDRAIRWLKDIRNAGHPFFLFVHYFDPHNPYQPPEPFFSRFAPAQNSPTELDKAIGGYDGEIALTDHEIGNLLKALKKMGLDDNTLVIITADHGEGLMEHKHMYHGVNIYEEAVRVPLLFRWPNHIGRGHVFSESVSLISLAPTILGLIGIKPDNRLFQGKSLAPVLRGETRLNASSPVYLYRRHYKGGIEGQTWVKGDKYGVITGSCKYIEGLEEKTKELYDLASDPMELKNLCTVYPKKAVELASHLKEWKREHVPTTTPSSKISKEDLETLKSLGYVE